MRPATFQMIGIALTQRKKRSMTSSIAYLSRFAESVSSPLVSIKARSTSDSLLKSFNYNLVTKYTHCNPHLPIFPSFPSTIKTFIDMSLPDTNTSIVPPHVTSVSCAWLDTVDSGDDILGVLSEALSQPYRFPISGDDDLDSVMAAIRDPAGTTITSAQGEIFERSFPGFKHTTVLAPCYSFTGTRRGMLRPANRPAVSCTFQATLVYPQGNVSYTDIQLYWLLEKAFQGTDQPWAGLKPILHNDISPGRANGVFSIGFEPSSSSYGPILSIRATEDASGQDDPEGFLESDDEVLF